MAHPLAYLFESPSPINLRHVPFSPDLTALVIGPHPDDFDAMAVTLRLVLHRGVSLVALIFRAGSGVPAWFASLRPAMTPTAIREDEQRASCEAFGLAEDALIFLDFDRDPYGELREDSANFDRLAHFVRQFQPDLVFLPHGEDTHPTHRCVARLFRRTAETLQRPMVAFWSRDPKTQRIRVDAFTPFDTGEAEWKARLLRFHASQHWRNVETRRMGLDERIFSVNRQTARALKCGFPYAEAFELEFFPGPSANGLLTSGREAAGHGVQPASEPMSDRPPLRHAEGSE